MSADLQPDVDDVLQEEGPATTTIPVCLTDVKTPVRTQALPRKGGTTFTRTLSETPLRVLTADHRRAAATLISLTAANVFLVAYNRASAQDVTTMMAWPGAVPLPVDATTEVWVRLPVDAEAFALGVSTSVWAEGE